MTTLPKDLEAGECAAFLKQIEKTPTDMLPRLVWADWLDENGGEWAVKMANYQRAVALLYNTVWGATEQEPMRKAIAAYAATLADRRAGECIRGMANSFHPRPSSHLMGAIAERTARVWCGLDHTIMGSRRGGFTAFNGSQMATRSARVPGRLLWLRGIGEYATIFMSAEWVTVFAFGLPVLVSTPPASFYALGARASLFLKYPWLDLDRENPVRRWLHTMRHCLEHASGITVNVA